MESNSIKDYEYDIALSFAGEDRAIIEKIANELRINGVSVFYDKYEEADLWGKDLFDHLSDVYQNKAKYCIVFISENYAKKVWTNHERKNAQARALEEKKEYILPVKLDDTEIPSIRKTVGFLDFRTHGVDGIVENTLIKIELAKNDNGDQKTDEMIASIPTPKIRKKITQKDKDLFLKKAYTYIKEYFNKGISKLGKTDLAISTDFNEITSAKFTCSIYYDGDIKNRCKIWLGGFSSSEIAYVEGNSASYTDDSSMNDYLFLTEKDGELGFNVGMGIFYGDYSNKDFITMHEAAEYFWKRFITALEE